MLQKFELESQLLEEAIKATFDRRKTEIPKEKPLAFSEEFYDDDTKKKQWAAFLNKNSINNTVELNELVKNLGEFLIPIVKAISTKK